MKRCGQVLIRASGAGREKRPIVEFALESAQAVRKMATKQAWQKTQAQGQAHIVTAFSMLNLSVSPYCDQKMWKAVLSSGNKSR